MVKVGQPLTQALTQPLTTALAADALLGGVAAPSWVPSPGGAPDIFFDFVGNRAYKRSGGVVAPVDSLLTVSRTSGKTVWNSAGVYSQVSSNVLARSDLGALIEEGRTNSIRNNSMQGGSAGVLPTNWNGTLGGSGLTQTIVGVGSENGIDYLEVRVAGTSSAVIGSVLVAEGVGVVAATAAQVWTQSILLKLTAGSLANLTGFDATLREYDSGTAFLRQTLASALSVGSSGYTRISSAVTLGASVASINSGVRISANSGVAIDFTIRIGWPQLELGSGASSPIVTSSGPVTRSADTVIVTSPPTFGSAYTLYGKGAANWQNSNQTIMQVDDGTSNNRAMIRRISNALSATVSGGTSVVMDTGTAWAVGSTGKIAQRVSAADNATVFNGGAPATSANPLPSGVANIRVGHTNGALYWNGFIAECGLFASRGLTNAQLQSITA